MVRLTRMLMSNISPLKRFVYNMSGFNQYGLMRDDVLYETPVIQEALRRLPSEVIDLRNYRMARALQLSLTHTILPKEQWTKIEEDVRYLKPLIEQVEKELKEKEEWATTH